MSNIKTLAYMEKVVLFAIGTGVPLLVPATSAFASSIDDPSSFLSAVETETNTSGASGSMKGDSVNSAVHNIVVWILGIAIGIFVMRVVLTAVDRMLISDSPDGSFLTNIPLVGAYPPPSRDGGYAWKDIWISFAKQLAICVGAWVIVEAILGLISWLLGTI